jgi:hypothetical protein
MPEVTLQMPTEIGATVRSDLQAEDGGVEAETGRRERTQLADRAAMLEWFECWAESVR